MDFPGFDNKPRLIVLAGDPDWCVERAIEAVGKQALWITASPLMKRSLIEWRGPAQARRLLGATTGHVVFDAHPDFDPDLFALTAGAIRGDCALLLLAPPLESWAERTGSRFLRRFIRGLRASPHPLLIEQGRGAEDPPSLSPPSPQTPPRPRSGEEALLDACLTRDQREAVEHILHVVRGHRRRPLVLRSDRGRGKSCALGIAALSLLEQGGERILVTAPRLAAVETLFSLLAALRPEGRATRGRFAWKRGEILFRPPDALVKDPEPADLLAVDEAAAIPAPMLERMLANWSRIVFATTEQGYEGNGRGFAIRFRKTLDRRTPGWRDYHLGQPIRWGENDALEQFVFDALLLKAKPVDELAPAETIHFERLDRDRLIASEPMLSELYGLLIAAHYRTTASDLRQLLDDPDITVFAALADSHIVGVALTIAEGGLPAELDRQARRGERRLKGHLAPQDLSAHLGVVGACERRCLRILRIATHPERQRQGIGAALLRQVASYARASGIDYLAASFGADPELLRFWDKAGFRAARLGARRNAVSGLHSALVIQSVSAAGEELVGQALRAFREALPHWLAEPLADVEPETIIALFPASGDAPPLNRETQAALEEFAHGNRSLLATSPALWRLTLACLESSRHRSELPILVMKILQKRSLTDIARTLGLTGKAEALQALRAAVGRIIGET